MAPQVKLYYSPGSCSMAGHFLLEESGVPFTVQKTNLRDPAERAEFVKTVNAKGQVPTLQIDNEIITEAPAIITAISQLVPEKGYTGRTPLETVRVYEWLNYLSGTVHTKSFTGLFRPSIFADDEENVRAHSKANVLDTFAVIEEKLADERQFALGDHFSGVDAYLSVYIQWARKFNFDLSPFPRYVAWFERLEQRPAFKAMQAQQA